MNKNSKNFIKLSSLMLVTLLVLTFVITLFAVNAQNDTYELPSTLPEGTVVTAIDENGNFVEVEEIKHSAIGGIMDINSNTYNLVDVDNWGYILNSYSTYSEAKAAFDSATKTRENNLGIMNNGRYIELEHGIVNFRTKTSMQNTNYTIDGTSVSGYTNGSYGGDGLYLGTNSDGTKFKFMQSGVIGWVNAYEVQLLPVEGYLAAKSTSHYYITSGRIQHRITVDPLVSSYASYLDNGPKQTYMSEGKKYYSFDGNYFYEDFEDMSTDVRNSTNDLAINANNAYYSYFQYLSHRTKTNFTASEINAYISANTTTSSKLRNTGQLFINNQNTYGANAILALGVSINESSWGNSYYAQNRNNLFGHAAYDSDPDNASGYANVNESIKYHAEYYISNGYLDPLDYMSRYYGSHLGNKNSGMNVKYASDPYWGEKAAHFLYKLEVHSGNQNIDYQSQNLSVKEDNSKIAIKVSPNSSSTTLYTTANKSMAVSDYPIIILDTVVGESINGNNVWYKIQTDPTLNSTGTSVTQDASIYNFSKYVGYIHSASFIKAEVDVTDGEGSADIYSMIYDKTKDSFNFKGYILIDGISNATTSNIKYSMVFKDINSDKEYEVALSRWANASEHPYSLGTNNSGGWLNSDLDLSSVPQGDYKLYIKAVSTTLEVELALENIFSKDITRKAENKAGRGYLLKNDYSKLFNPMFMSIRDDGLISNSIAPTFHSIISDFSYMKFVSGKLDMIGTSYNIGLSYDSNVTRKLVIENIATMDTYSYDMNAVEADLNNKYMANIPPIAGDNTSKKLGWYNCSIDLGDLPVGSYNMYVSTKTGTFEDYGFIYDMFYANTITTNTYNGKTYTVAFNKELGYFKLTVK